MSNALNSPPLWNLDLWKHTETIGMGPHQRLATTNNLRNTHILPPAASNLPAFGRYRTTIWQGSVNGTKNTIGIFMRKRPVYLDINDYLVHYFMFAIQPYPLNHSTPSLAGGTRLL